MDTPLRAGDLTEQIVIEAKNLEDNGRGGRKRPEGGPEWIEIDTVWAEIIALRGEEALAHNIQRSVQLYRVRIWARDDVTTAHRLRWGTIAMNIRSATPSRRRDALVMTTESGVPT